MAKKKRYEFDELDHDSDWGEYKKSSKKKTKHREEAGNWRFDKRQDHRMEEHDEYDDYDRKARDW